jgi:hypothetical protein
MRRDVKIMTECSEAGKRRPVVIRKIPNKKTVLMPNRAILEVFVTALLQ